MRFEFSAIKEKSKEIQRTIEEKCKAKRRKKKEWHKWFAWHPIKLWLSDDYHEIVWFEKVERRGLRWSRGSMDTAGMGHYWEWLYREVGSDKP